MSVFVTIFCFEILAGLLYLLYRGKSDKRTFVYMFIAFLPLAYIQIFKDPYYLPDLPYYVMGFDGVDNMSVQQILHSGIYINHLKAEPTWFLFNRFIHLFSNDITVLFAIVGVLTLLGNFLFIRKFSPYIVVSLLIYFVGPFYQSLYVLRQHLAIAIFFFSLQYIVKGNPIKFLISISVGFFFHQSIIVVLPLYYLYHINNNRKLTLYLVCGGSALLLFFGLLLSYVVQYYVGHDEALYDDANYKIVIVYGIFLLFRIMVLRDKFYEEGVNKILSLLCVITFVVALAGMTFGSIDRLNMYFANANYVILPQTVSKMHNKTLRAVALVSLIILWSTMFFVGFQKSDISKFQLISTVF